MQRSAGLQRAAGSFGPPAPRPRGARRERPCGILPWWQEPQPLPVAACPPARRADGNLDLKEGNMFSRQPLGPPNLKARHASVLLGSLLLALAAGPPARA